MQVDAHAERGRAAGTSDIQGIVVRQLERTLSTREVPEEVCGAYRAGAFDSCELQEATHFQGMARTVPCHRVSFAMSQRLPWSSNLEAITMVVSTSVRPYPAATPAMLQQACRCRARPSCSGHVRWLCGHALIANAGVRGGSPRTFSGHNFHRLRRYVGPRGPRCCRGR